ncbi:MAG TPA: hypothetical protein VF195_03355 [Actinomycetota bacterium]
MKRGLIGAVMFLLVVALLRRVGRPLGERAMEKCQEMFERGMPERRGLPSERTVAPARR